MTQDQVIALVTSWNESTEDNCSTSDEMSNRLANELASVIKWIKENTKAETGK